MTLTQLLGVVCLGVVCGLSVWLIVQADRRSDRQRIERQATQRHTLSRLFPDGQPERDPDDQHLLDLYFPHEPPAAAGLTSERTRLDRAIVLPFRKSAS